MLPLDAQRCGKRQAGPQSPQSLLTTLSPRGYWLHNQVEFILLCHGSSFWDTLGWVEHQLLQTVFEMYQWDSECRPWKHWCLRLSNWKMVHKSINKTAGICVYLEFNQSLSCLFVLKYAFYLCLSYRWLRLICSLQACAVWDSVYTFLYLIKIDSVYTYRTAQIFHNNNNNIPSAHRSE